MLQQPPPKMPTNMGFIPTPDERNLAMLSHLSALGGLVFLGGLGFIGPLIIYLVQKEKSQFVAFHARDSLNHQLTLLLFNIVCAVLAFVLFCLGGFLAFIPVIIAFVTSIIFEILASIQASRGEWTKIPLAIPLVR
jgi:uncharacterized Tic20 family protein